jgi:hypothetical protein
MILIAPLLSSKPSCLKEQIKFGFLDIYYYLCLVNLFTNTDVFYLFIKIMKAIYSNENRTFLDEFISSC